MVIDDNINFLYFKSEVNCNNEGDRYDDDKHDKKECNDSLIILVQKQVNFICDIHLNKFTSFGDDVGIVNDDKKIGIYLIVLLSLGDVKILVYVDSEIGSTILTDYRVCVPGSLSYACRAIAISDNLANYIAVLVHKSFECSTHIAIIEIICVIGVSGWG